METGYFFGTKSIRKRMRKRLYMLLLGCTTLLCSQAQVLESGYYRVQNAKTNRWMSLCDNHSRGVDLNSTTADCGALQTTSNWETISSDPGSVFYIENKGDKSGDANTIVTDITGQGTGIKQLIDYYLYITKVGKYYMAWQEDKGQRVKLGDTDDDDEIGYVITTGNANNWYIEALNTTDNYIGVKPTITIGGKHYAALLTGFPYTLGEGMKAYYVNKIDEGHGMAVYKELTGTIPGNTPVLIACNSTEVKDNQITPVTGTFTAPTDNKLQGVFFCLGERWSGHYNATKYDANSMRMLAVSSDGKLAATTSTEHLSTVMIADRDTNGKHLTIQAVPANSWYLPVSASAPAELKLVSADEYTTGITTITPTSAKQTYDVYTLSGIQLKKNAKSYGDLPKGLYIINGKKVAIH